MLTKRETSNTWFCLDTPLEKYILDGVEVWVKRDDLFGVPPAPPLGKLRGLRVLLKKIRRSGGRLVGCWDTRVSSLGQGVAAACRDYSGMRCIISYPTKKGAGIPDAVVRAKHLGAEVHPVPGGRITISFARAREYVEAEGGVMLPFGLECQEAVQAVAEEARRLPDEAICGGTVVLSCGSGTTLAGLLRGIGDAPQRFVGVSAGRSIKAIHHTLRRHGRVPDSVCLIEAPWNYAHRLDTDCPFPAHPNYDLKAWAYLRKRIAKMPQPILFWNIGS